MVMYGSLSARLVWPVAGAGVVVAGVWLLLPVYYLYIANQLMTYMVLALGLSLLLGWAGQFAFAHMAFFGIGIYATALLDGRLGLPFVLAMPLAAALAGLVGLVIAIPSTRLRTIYLALATFAFAESARWVFQSWTQVTGGVDGLRIGAARIFGLALTDDRIAFPFVFAMMLLVVLATACLLRSRLGRDFCAIRDSEHVATAAGIDVRRAKIVAFVLSAVYAGLAGGMFTLFHSFVNAEVAGVQPLVIVLTMIVVGGSASLPGVALGVVVMGIIPELLRAAPTSLLTWQEFFYGAILILAIMFMPRGIWGVIEDRLAPAAGAGRR
jgi:branched-chain amino acid transport system permease protein